MGIGVENLGKGSIVMKVFQCGRQICGGHRKIRRDDIARRKRGEPAGARNNLFALDHGVDDCVLSAKDGDQVEGNPLDFTRQSVCAKPAPWLLFP